MAKDYNEVVVADIKMPFGDKLEIKYFTVSSTVFGGSVISDMSVLRLMVSWGCSGALILGVFKVQTRKSQNRSKVWMGCIL